MPALPSGTVTFLFSDVEGSTALLERHGGEMGAALARHHELFEAIAERHGGAIFETVGDAVYAAFPTAPAGVAAALDAQRALAATDWGPIERLAVRIALHSGPVERRGRHYFGAALFRAARLQALGYGEQTLLSGVTARLAADALPDGATLRDLGRQRLKDLGEPEQVFQLVHPDLRAEFPALKSLDAHPHNLPAQLSSFVGRERELADLAALLAEHRLITLLGPGGTGKTRLALQAAAEQLERFGDGAWFVDLSGLRDPELVPGAIATALGLREQPGTPISATLAKHLAAREVLLVLDNLEQLLPAAAASVGALLGAAPDLHVLATSRAPLRLRGEREYFVPPLPVGDPGRLEPEPPAAVALFVDRARATRPDLELTPETGPLLAAICARLDGLPLAIELAAARLRTFNVAQLHERLARRLPLLAGGARDLPARQQTLRDAIGWSVDLLSESERRLFARLGVFVGGCTLEAAEAVAGPQLGGEVLDGLTTLLEHSLLRRVDDASGAPRYTMLETIREYALELLEASGEAEAARERHWRRMLELLTVAYELPAGDERRTIYDQVEADLDNLRAACAWLQDRGREELLQLVSVAASFWSRHNHAAEGRTWVFRALEGAPNGDPIMRGRIQMAAWGLHYSGGGTAAQGSDAIAEAVALFEAAGAERDLGMALALLGNDLQIRGRPGEARAPLERAITIAERYGDDVIRRRALNSLALDLVSRGDVAAGERALTEVFEAAVRSDDLQSIFVTGSDLAQLRYAIGNPDAAERPARAAIEAGRRSGRVDATPFAHLGTIQALRGDFAQSRASLATALEMCMEGGDNYILPGVFEGWAIVEARDGDPVTSAYCLAAAQALAAELLYVASPVEKRFSEELAELVRTLLADDQFADAWERGLKATVDEAIAVLRQRASLAGGRDPHAPTRGRRSFRRSIRAESRPFQDRGARR